MFVQCMSFVCMYGVLLLGTLYTMLPCKIIIRWLIRVASQLPLTCPFIWGSNLSRLLRKCRKHFVLQSCLTRRLVDELIIYVLKCCYSSLQQTILITVPVMFHLDSHGKVSASTSESELLLRESHGRETKSAMFLMAAQLNLSDRSSLTATPGP